MKLVALFLFQIKKANIEPERLKPYKNMNLIKAILLSTRWK